MKMIFLLLFYGPHGYFASGRLITGWVADCPNTEEHGGSKLLNSGRFQLSSCDSLPPLGG